MTQVIDFIGGEYRNRTGVHGFAIRCVTTPPTRLGVLQGIYCFAGVCKMRLETNLWLSAVACSG